MIKILVDIEEVKVMLSELLEVALKEDFTAEDTLNHAMIWLDKRFVKTETINEPRFLLDEYSICYGCPYYKKKNEVIYDHTEDDFDENGGCCDVHCVCLFGSMNTYNKGD